MNYSSKYGLTLRLKFGFLLRRLISTSFFDLLNKDRILELDKFLLIHSDSLKLKWLLLNNNMILENFWRVKCNVLTWRINFIQFIYSYTTYLRVPFCFDFLFFFYWDFKPLLNKSWSEKEKKMCMLGYCCQEPTYKRLGVHMMWRKPIATERCI